MTPERPAQRDPRRDPIPGDHLHKRGKRFWFDRWVKQINDPDVLYSDQYGQACCCGISAWRKWAATAIVVRWGEQ